MSKADCSTTSRTHSIRFMGRQPILDRERQTYGHELLFRSGLQNQFSGDPEAATRDVIDHLLLLMPSEDHQASFVNCTREALVSGIVTLLPPERTVLEIVETVRPDQELMECCLTLRTKGYRFALDDFSPEETQRPFLAIADFIKVDFLQSDAATRCKIYAMAEGTKMRFIAEKVETEDDVKVAREALVARCRSGDPHDAAYGFATLEPDMKTALLGAGGPLDPALDLVRCHETGDWGRHQELQARLSIPDSKASTLYIDSAT